MADNKDNDESEITPAPKKSVQRANNKNAQSGKKASKKPDYPFSESDSLVEESESSSSSSGRTNIFYLF